ncbi:MAG TPA: helix-turn-helix transcriptional regulator [Candidatus Competibacteraceae bacterium]|nr:helix-turn-helix transcriptional regulator [Candidatus Competibacteraceae bacterium]
MPTLAHQVGHRIRVRRTDLKLTQTQLARAVGIGQGQMSHLERGNKYMSLEMLERIAQALKCTPVDLLDSNKQAA